LNTLRFFAGKDFFEAGKGFGGQKQKKYGEDGEDVVLEVPVGTIVKVRVDDYRLLRGREFYGEGAEELKHSGMKLDKVPYLTFEERWEVQGQADSEWIEVADLDKPDKEIVLAYGGRGGKGNFVYRSSALTTPRFAQTGETGERFRVRLELKVLADVGLVGMPNVGKSTLLSVLTAAKPEVGDYPFTTLSPNLGVLVRGESVGKEVVIADIPGLIEDAHKGKGLGDEFLRHVERCKVLVYVLAPEITTDTDMKGVEWLWQQYESVRQEVEYYGHELERKQSLVVVNKVDILQVSRSEIETFFKTKGVMEIMMVSAATREGIEMLKRRLWETV